jgi:hypothetical protein
MPSEAVLSAITEAVFTYLLDYAGPVQKGRSYLGHDPVRLAFQVALARAYTTASVTPTITRPDTSTNTSIRTPTATRAPTRMPTAPPTATNLPSPLEFAGQIGGFYDQNVAIQNRDAFVVGYDAGLRIIDAANPASPGEVGVAIVRNSAYVPDDAAGLRLVNVVNLTSPDETGACDLPGAARSVTVAGDYTYVADGPSGLRLVNVPIRPAQRLSASTTALDTP